MAVTRQQLEQQLVAAHRTKNVQAAQQAAYAIRAYDQNMLSAQVPSINAPPPIDRVPKPTFGSWLGNVTAGIGEGLGEQVQGLGGMIERGVTAFAQDPLKASAAAFMTALEPARQGFTQPVQATKDIGTGIVETGKQMYQQATSGPIGLGQTMGQMIDLPGPSLPGGKRRPTMAELDVYHGTPHTFDPEEGAPLGRFRSEKIGTGEGAQSYGYGLYLAESRDTGATYRNPGGPRGGTIPIDIDGVPAGRWSQKPELSPVEARAADTIARTRNPDYAIDYLEQDAKYNKTAAEAIDWIKQNRHRFSDPGNLYKVDLPDAKIEQMMDWDKPISQQPAMQKAFNKFWKGLSKDERAQAVFDEFGDYDLAKQMAKSPGEVRGRLAYTLMTHHFGDQAAASDFLRQQGVPGIKYLDAGSRGIEKGTRNFVVFPGEEQSLNILERDGVKAEVPKPDELAYHGTTKQAAAAIEREGFDLTRAADGTVWLTSNPNIGEVAATGKGGMVSRSVSGLKLGGWDEMDKYSTDELIAKGYDGLRLKDGDEITYQIFNPEKLKVPTKAEVPKPKTPSFTDALNNLVRPDLEDDQVFSKPLPPVDADNLDYVGKFGASSTGTGGMHVSVRDGIKNAGPHEFFFYDNNDEPLGFARLTKNKKQASINMIALNEEGRGRGFGKSFYKYLLDDLGVEVKSDKEITQGTAGIYESLAKEYPTRVDDDGRVVISPKSEVPKAAAPKTTTWQGMSREEFLGDPKITTNRNAADLKPRALTTVVTEQPKPFKGNLTIRMNEDGAAVYDGDKVIASYNFGDTLVVDKKYRKQGIGEELIYQWRKANPTAPPAKERTKASQAIQEKVWQRLLNEQG